MNRHSTPLPDDHTANLTAVVQGARQPLGSRPGARHRRLVRHRTPPPRPHCTLSSITRWPASLPSSTSKAPAHDYRGRPRTQPGCVDLRDVRYPDDDVLHLDRRRVDRVPRGSAAWGLRRVDQTPACLYETSGLARPPHAPALTGSPAEAPADWRLSAKAASQCPTTGAIAAHRAISWVTLAPGQLSSGSPLAGPRGAPARQMA